MENHGQSITVAGGHITCEGRRGFKATYEITGPDSLTVTWSDISTSDATRDGSRMAMKKGSGPFAVIYSWALTHTKDGAVVKPAFDRPPLAKPNYTVKQGNVLTISVPDKLPADRDYWADFPGTYSHTPIASNNLVFTKDDPPALPNQSYEVRQEHLVLYWCDQTVRTNEWGKLYSQTGAGWCIVSGRSKHAADPDLWGEHGKSDAGLDLVGEVPAEGPASGTYNVSGGGGDLLTFTWSASISADLAPMDAKDAARSPHSRGLMRLAALVAQGECAEQTENGGLFRLTPAIMEAEPALFQDRELASTLISMWEGNLQFAPEELKNDGEFTKSFAALGVNIAKPDPPQSGKLA